MNRILLCALVALSLSACGGGGDSSGSSSSSTTNVFTDPNSAIVSPLEPTSSTPTTTSTVTPTTPTDGTTTNAQPKPCRIPQASETGIEHGNPPVDRCD